MFELNIERLTRKETRLFGHFRKASSYRLRGHDVNTIPFNFQQEMLQDDYSSGWSSDEYQNAPHTMNGDMHSRHDHKTSDSFVNDLLNIDKEAALPVDCKDVEDKLDVLTSVLPQQRVGEQQRFLTWTLSMLIAWADKPKASMTI
ncbi:uncharacterized protein Z519_10817 [Cladophialophora bantiana CBS 173.52]|uniref:Uncharacterized protein n=1 Tax=Cladophialophora bantiana (strain ATCC 10958 / CBS 173.52 / CDC B-1940 / NIH 8579) TaxID=1442370 RepID=A0A0D2HD05_CLAB1|nr:uncharacterized protein Z519_10817 [Cladophialophora bantiana CBS 173.52]KIW88770.1 hypothetical protein Z519_10817 [Cladophialophora bantiana CBS 173.52]